MKEILFISTGGTFNKHYDSDSGSISIDTEATTLQEIAYKWRTVFNIKNIIGKDSLDIDNRDRDELLYIVQKSSFENIIIIHGTDTMHTSAKLLAEADIPKSIVFTGAMTPYRVDKVEATSNVVAAYGFLTAGIEHGVYISMNGILERYNRVIKNRNTKRFELV